MKVHRLLKMWCIWYYLIMMVALFCVLLIWSIIWTCSIVHPQDRGMLISSNEEKTNWKDEGRRPDSQSCSLAETWLEPVTSKAGSRALLLLQVEPSGQSFGMSVIWPLSTSHPKRTLVWAILENADIPGVDIERWGGVAYQAEIVHKWN